MPNSVTVYRDSTRSVSLNALPPEAWTQLFGPSDQTGDVAALFASVPFMYRAVQMRAQAMSALPFAIMKGDKDQDIDKLGYMRGFVQLLYRIEQSLCLYGSAYVLPQQNRVKTLGFRWLSPATITPQFDKNRGLTGFERSVGKGAKPEFFKPEEIIYFWLPDAEVEIGPGKSPAYTAMAAAGALHGIDTFIKAFFERGAINTTLLQVEGNPPPAEMLRLEAWWKRLLSGVKKAYETVAIRASVKPIVIGSPPKELAMQELTTAKREDIATAFGIPYSLIFSNASNFATAKQDDLHFYTKTIIPASGYIAATLTDQWFSRFGLEFKFLPETLEIFQMQESEKAERLVQLYTAGIMTKNEVREQMELEPLPEEEANDTATPIVEQEPAPQEAVPAETVPPSKDYQADRMRWQKKAIKALKDGKPAAVAFASDHIPTDEQATIIAMLSLATTADEVRAAFKSDKVDGVGNPLEAPQAVTIDAMDIQEALQEWDDTMPDYAGLLDAEVVDS
jgi:HK97 family phage portal protein